MSLQSFKLSDGTRKILANYTESGAFPHTMLLEGDTAEQRLLLAKEIANRILCTSENTRPCGACSACIKCKANSHPDIREYGEINTTSTFKVDVCREIRSDCFIIPNDGDKKIYILKDVQNMNDSSQNALLKILEEPPTYVYFILTCDSRSSMLSTVLSRATVLSLGDSGEDREYSDKVIEFSHAFAASLTKGDALRTLEVTGTLEKDKETFKASLLYLYALFLDALAIKNGANLENESAKEIAASLTSEKLYALVKTLKELHTGVTMNQNYNLLLTSLCYQCRKCVQR